MDRFRDLATVDELAARLGSPERALALLEELRIPVVSEVFSERLLLMRLEERAVRLSAVPGELEGDPLAIVAHGLAPFGLILQKSFAGRPSVLELVADRALRLGEVSIERGEQSPIAPIELVAGESVLAALYVANKRLSDSAVFNLARIPPSLAESVWTPQGEVRVFLMLLVPERRLWLITARELTFFYADLRASRKRRGFRLLQREGSMRVVFPRASSPFDASTRIEAT